MTDNLTIRGTHQNDVALILQFIKELAEYEKLSHEVVATGEQLKNNLFGENPQAEAVIAEWQGEPAGLALFFHNFSTFAGKQGLYLEDLYVQPQYRGHGIGKALLVYLAKLARQRDCARFEWAVLDWNKPARDFYEGLGAECVDEWRIYRATGDKLDKLGTQE